MEIAAKSLTANGIDTAYEQFIIWKFMQIKNSSTIVGWSITWMFCVY